MKKLILKSVFAVVVLFTAFAFAGCGAYQGTTNDRNYDDYSYSNPAWAPAYYMGTRYYYFPDIEAYYDLASRDFIFLNNGQWLFVQSISPFYSGFDLNNSFVIVINRGVYQPWMHHHYYNSHYPRYYYIDYYDYSNIPYVRGFNENQKGAIYWSENQRNRARTWDDRNLRNNRRFTYSDADRRVQQETTRQTNVERSSRTGADRTSTVNQGRTTEPTRTQTTGTSRTNTTGRTETTTTRGATTTGNDANTTRGVASPRTDAGTNRTGTQTSTSRAADTNYYGEPIGRPVRVEPQMRNSETTPARSSRTTGTDTNTRTGSGSSRTSDRK